MKEKNRFAIMKKEFHDSQHIKIPKHINECRVEVKKAQQTKNSKRKSSFKVFSQINEKPNSKAIILPQMETKDHPSTNCLVVDLLQLADSYSQGFKYKHIEQRLGNSLEADLLCSSIGTQDELHHFDLSANSFPETYFNQKKGKNFRRSSKKTAPTSTQQNENRFSKSWPLVPCPCDEIQTRFPKLAIEQKLAPNEISNLSKDLRKFNHSRPFRMNKLFTLEEIANRSPLQTNIEPTDKKSKVNRMYDISISRGENHLLLQSDDKHFTTELDLKDSKKDKINANHAKKEINPEANSSTGSDLTNVTKEIVMKQDDEKRTNFRISNGPSVDINRKCMQWLEDVAKERLENPDKLFLPHLLSP